jgi:predicted nucleic acid-binding Zn finger protein
VYRKRELTREPLPAAALRFASAREEEAAKILHQGKVAVDEVTESDGRLKISGRVQYKGKVMPAWFVLDVDRRLVEGQCTCDYFIRNRLHRGPCDHLLALRAAQRRGISDLIEVRGEPASASARGTAARAAVERGQGGAQPRATGAGPTGLTSLPLVPSFWQQLILVLKRLLRALLGG